MKKLILVFGILFSMAGAADLQWYDDFDTAALKAKKEHKALMVMVESEHCGWCKEMKKTTLNDNKVKAQLQSFVLVRVMREDAGSISFLPAISGVPTIFFMTTDKQILEQVIGYFDEEDFLPFIADAKNKLKHISK